MSTSARLEIGPDGSLSARVLLTAEQWKTIERMRQATLARYGMAPGSCMILRGLEEALRDDPSTRGELDVR